MRVAEFRNLNDSELLTKFLDLKEELFNLRFQNATGSLEKSHLIKSVKKDIARVETIINERNIDAEDSAQAEGDE